MATDFFVVKFNIVDIITIIRSPKHRRWAYALFYPWYIYLSMPTLLVINTIAPAFCMNKNTKFKWSRCYGVERKMFDIFIHVFTFLSCHCGHIMWLYACTSFVADCRPIPSKCVVALKTLQVFMRCPAKIETKWYSRHEIVFHIFSRRFAALTHRRRRRSVASLLCVGPN